MVGDDQGNLHLIKLTRKEEQITDLRRKLGLLSKRDSLDLEEHITSQMVHSHKRP